jgi:hypothetical protein
MSLGAAIYLGCAAYWCWAVRGIIRACGGSGDKAEILGVVLPYPIGMTLLVVSRLILAFVAIYAFFIHTQSTT